MPVLDPWEGQPLDAVLATCCDLLEDDTFPTVARWRDRGGRTLGHFQVYFPEELAHAAGMLPFKVRGSALEPRTAASHFGSYLCSIV
jgi:benzoyl-CoA reductase subunit C